MLTACPPQIQNSRVLDMEFQIPLQPLPHDPTKPDLTTVRKAWWDVINLVYADEGNSPLRLTLELRIMGDSNMLMAPQYGNDLGKKSSALLCVRGVITTEIFRG
jgi:hypothetical protein